jgi:hypothetical protein
MERIMSLASSLTASHCVCRVGAHIRHIECVFDAGAAAAHWMQGPHTPHRTNTPTCPGRGAHHMRSRHTHTHTRTHACTHAHTHTHTHTHTNTPHSRHAASAQVHLARGKADVPRRDLLQDGRVAGPRKGRDAGQQDEHDDARGPHINGGAVAAGEHLCARCAHCACVLCVLCVLGVLYVRAGGWV